ncbi:MAG: AzlD domain-containing protein [Clostridia bacterium]|nr:AzlD domain-containing protein [Clostridia bacterium]
MYKAYIYIAIMALTIFLIRVLPLTLIRKKIKNKTLRSFLFYVPYVTLSVMTFPAIIYATNNIWSGVAALVAGVMLAYKGVSLLGVAVSSCAVVFVIELIIKLM